MNSVPLYTVTFQIRQVMYTYKHKETSSFDMSGILEALLKLYVACIFIFVGVCNAECPDGWTRYQSSCYFFGHHDMTFMESEHFCTHYGAHLVTIENAVENNFIASVLHELNSNRHWIGLTDEIVEGVWRWYSTDQVASYTDWYPGQPDLGSKANCANIYSAAPYAYHWLDDECEKYRFRPICEKGINSETQIVG